MSKSMTVRIDVAGQTGPTQPSDNSERVRVTPSGESQETRDPFFAAHSFRVEPMATLTRTAEVDQSGRQRDDGHKARFKKLLGAAARSPKSSG